MENIYNIDTAKSYATEENLEKALEKVSLGNVPYMVVRNRTGRFTAIFSYAQCEARNVNPGTPAHLGFKIIG